MNSSVFIVCLNQNTQKRIETLLIERLPSIGVEPTLDVVDNIMCGRVIDLINYDNDDIFTHEEFLSFIA